MHRPFYSLVLLCSFGFSYASSLQEIFEIAQENGMTWKSRKLEHNSQQLTGDVAMGAILPSMSVSASQSSGISYYGSYDSVNGASLTRDPSGESSFSQTAINVQCNIPIYAPASLAAYHSAQISEKIAQEDYRLFQHNYVLELAIRYFDILKKDKSLILSKSQVHMREKFFHDVKERYDVGLVAHTDLREATAALDQAKSAEIQAAFALSSSQAALKILISSDIHSLQDLSWDSPIKLPFRLQEQGVHPSLSKALYAVEYSQAQVKQAKATLMPALQGFSSYSVAPLNQNISRAANSLTAGLSLSWSPPNGVGTLAQINQYAYLYESSQAQYIQATLTHQTQLRLYAEQFYSALRNIDAQRVSVVSSITYLDAVEASFEAGQRTTTDVLEAQQFLIQQQETLYSLLYDALVLHLRLGLENNHNITDIIADIDAVLTVQYNQP